MASARPRPGCPPSHPLLGQFSGDKDISGCSPLSRVAQLPTAAQASSEARVLSQVRQGWGALPVPSVAPAPGFPGEGSQGRWRLRAGAQASLTLVSSGRSLQPQRMAHL